MLTEQQAETIAIPSEHKLIVALPGSGKTHTSISLADNILEESPTYNLMMVTFTNAAATEMKERIEKRLGKKKAKRVLVNTFASLMMQQAKKISRGRKIIMGAEQITYVKRAMIAQKINIDEIENYTSLIEEYGRILNWESDNTPSANVYSTYNALLKKFHKWDLNMMAREIILSIRNGDMDAYPHTHIICDEFQDTDELQYLWLAAHGKKGAYLSVVGDDDQAIYGWRGSLGYSAFVKMQEDFNAKGYLLGKCFRCAPAILSVAERFISHNTDRIDKDMDAVKEAEGEVIIKEFPKSIRSEFTKKLLGSEDGDIADSGTELNADALRTEVCRVAVEQMLEYDGKWAVLARTNKQLDRMETALREQSVPVKRIGGKSIFDNEHALGISQLFYALVAKKAPSELETGMAWIGESEDAIHEIYHTEKTIGFTKSTESNSSWKAVTFRLQEAALKWKFDKKILPENAIKEFSKLIKEHIKARKDKDHKLQSIVLDILVKMLKSYEGDLFSRAKNLLRALSGGAKSSDDENHKAVVLTTMNGSKGLEWQNVWIMEAQDKVCPMIKDADALSPEELTNQIEEERRLLYVAMTRAEERLVISYIQGTASDFLEEFYN